MFHPRLPRILALALLLMVATVSMQAADAWKPLFNGKDLTGWETWLGKPDPSVELGGLAKDDKGVYAGVVGANRDPLNVFSVVNVDGRPAIRITGQIFGGITTKEEYGNYHVRLQFKWGDKKWAPREKAETPRDSGLLYHVHSAWNFNNRIWPRSPEVQIQERDCGDLFAIGCQMTVRARQPDPAQRLFYYDPMGKPTDFIEQAPIGNRCIRLEDREKPHGEWNTIELICVGDESIHIVNGGVVMRLTNARRLDGAAPAPLTAGKLLLQSEGAEIFFRDVELRPITAVPAEFVEK